MVTDTGEYTLTHASNNTRRIARTLINTKLDILPSKEKSASSEEHGRRLCSDTSPSAAFREQERDRLVEQGLGRHFELGELCGLLVTDLLRSEPWRGEVFLVVCVREDAENLGS